MRSHVGKYRRRPRRGIKQGRGRGRHPVQQARLVGQSALHPEAERDEAGRVGPLLVGQRCEHPHDARKPVIEYQIRHGRAVGARLSALGVAQVVGQEFPAVGRQVAGAQKPAQQGVVPLLVGRVPFVRYAAPGEAVNAVELVKSVGVGAAAAGRKPVEERVAAVGPQRVGRPAGVGADARGRARAVGLRPAGDGGPSREQYQQTGLSQQVVLHGSGKKVSRKLAYPAAIVSPHTNSLTSKFSTGPCWGCGPAPRPTSPIAPPVACGNCQLTPSKAKLRKRRKR